MRIIPRSSQGFWLSFLIFPLLFSISCKKSHDEAKKIVREETQLNLPEMSPTEKTVADSRLEWNMATMYDVYEKSKYKNPKWDSDARSALKFFAQVRSYGTNIKGFPDLLNSYVVRAAELGCNDPMIKYLNVRFQPDKRSRLQFAREYAGVSDAMDSSDYGPIRRFYVAKRAVDYYLKIKPWPDEGNTYIDRACQNFNAALEDKSIPVGEIDEAGREVLQIIERCVDEKERFARMEKILLKNWATHGVAYLLQGQFYIDYAWVGRTGAFADKVTKEQWAMFFERLDMAEKCLLKGMEVDPKDGRLPTKMITVASAEGKELPEMMQWWEKAMEADTNNYDACDTMLHFLLPRWSGSRNAMIAFGRMCLASEKFGGTVPLVLAEAHYKFNSNDGPADGSYWLLPDVWPDIKMSYEKFFELNPKAISWRHNYARFAYWCQQWDTLNEQIELMGTDINYSFFGGQDEYNKMLKLAKEHAAPAAK